MYKKSASKMGKNMLLLDVDPGVDDAQALLMVLAVPNIQIMGITCCHGNTGIENVCRNVLRVLKLCGRMEIPVYRGSAASILGERLHDPVYHGKDGLGDVPDPNAPGLEHLQMEHAVNAMIRIVSEHPGQISLVAVGPLTNVALAVKMDATFPSKLKRLYIMGGNMEGRGNVKVASEFNFVTDAEAAYVVLSQFTCPTYIATWEYCLRHRLPWEFYKEWVNQDTEKARFMKRISAHTAERAKSEAGSKELFFGPGFVSCDSFAMAAAIDESVVTEYSQLGVTVELHGSLTRGMMILDTLDLLKIKNRAFVMMKCDMEKYKQLLIASLK
ncbi:probable uridine nucleosidase 1 [Callorhinchus milii]|uniref:Si:dkey-4e7.3 n=2 Tax=Callorhinchus milii TaxID=7868 RepID=A0A4W3JY35_CALMI|nr:probable uridine nucleosidase 1 [Callorhinchus milii]|eukprot:gi/632947925/ref/XP_007889312.1/ PREDICTED: probable uridine nucleosidase 1 [Callorhinchus milii]